MNPFEMLFVPLVLEECRRIKSAAALAQASGDSRGSRCPPANDRISTDGLIAFTQESLSPFNTSEVSPATISIGQAAAFSAPVILGTDR